MVVVGVGVVDCCPICPALGFTAAGPTWRVPRPGPIHLHPCLSGTDNLCIGSLQPPRYVSALLTGAPVWLLTRQWREIQVRQCLTSLWPTHAPAHPFCAFVDLGLIFERPELGAHPRLPTDTPNIPANSHRRCTFIVLYFAFSMIIQCFPRLWLTYTFLANTCSPEN